MANRKNKNSKKSSQSSSKFVFWTVGIIAAFILGFILIGNHTKPPDEKAKPKDTIDYSNQPYLGDKSAPVSIIEFGDYKCPNCKNFAANVVPVIQKKLIDNGKAKLYFMNDAFIYDDSFRAAKFAESIYQELGNNTFWKFHELLYKKQPEDSKYEKMDVYDEKFLTDVLKEVASDSDVKKVVSNFESKKSDPAFNKDMDYVQKLGVTGTPTIFVDGKMFKGQTMDDLIAMVDKAAKKKGKGNE